MKQRLVMILGPLICALALLLAACGSPSGENTPNTVQITETDFHISSSIATFSPGVTYHFVVTNNGNTTHEFMIMPKSEGDMSSMPMEQMDKMALHAVENILPGETKTFNYAFPSSTANTHPQFACYLSGHYQAGMHENVTVK